MDLSIGMACYDDFHGVAFSIQSLVLHHDLVGCEIIVIDNNPTSAHGRETRDFCAKMAGRPFAPVRYIAMPGQTGTTQTRERIFAEAQGRAVLVMDCHVLFAAGAIGRLKDWYRSNPEALDIVSGPLILDHFQDFHTHFNDQWRGQMWGTWATAWTCDCQRPLRFTTIELTSDVEYRDLATSHTSVDACTGCGRALPPHAWAGHQQALSKAGFRPLGFNSDDPVFEIPGQGLGVFSCRKAAWPGFNPHFRGFGGEELYIHTKIRRHGGQALCLPWLKWWHRFGRPDGVQYPIKLWNKARNYVLGHTELGLDLAPVHQHFVSLDTQGNTLIEHLVRVHAVDPTKLVGKSREELLAIHLQQKISEADWQHLIADPVRHVTQQSAGTTVSFETGRPQPPDGATLDEIFEWCKATPRDLEKHLPKLKELAAKCDHVTEITKRRESTIGLAAGRPKTLVSYQREADIVLKTLSLALLADAKQREGDRHVETLTTHWGADSSAMDTIAATDMLYLDTVMTAERLALELNQQADQVRRFILIRGTGSFGEKAEGIDAPGLFHTLRPFLIEHPGWFVYYHSPDEYGITVIGRQPQDRPLHVVHAWPPGYGPGTEFKRMAADELGIAMPNSCTCNALALEMDRIGVTGCREQYDHLVAQIKQNSSRWGWADKFSNYARASFGSLTSGLLFKINWLDPIPGLVTEAIRRAEAVEQARVAA